LFFIFYVSSQFAAGGKILKEAFDVPLLSGMGIVANIIIVYCMAGGFLSVVWTDVMQAILMIVTLGVIPVIGLLQIHAQGLSITSALSSIGPDMISWTGGVEGAAAGLLIGTHLSWIFGYMGGEPHFFIRQMAVRSEKERRTAILVAVIWGAIAMMGSWLIGIVALTLFGGDVFDVPHAALSQEVAEGILPYTLLRLAPHSRREFFWPAP
jgi:sodium/proline symporter